jgi:prefoldin subunit 5
MATSGAPQSPDLSASLDQLSKTAISLNKASDGLNQAINQLNDALKKLNLGISSWVSFYVYEEGPFSDVHEIGYGKVNGNWGIAIKKTFEDAQNAGEDSPDVTEWQFSEAPRDMRIEAIPYLPKVIEQLNKDADRTTQLLKDKTADAENLAAAIEAIIDPPRRSVATRHQGGR